MRERKVAEELERGLTGVEEALGVAPDDGADGPLRERLRGLGGVSGVVGGAFGGGSAGMHRLVGMLAKRAAEERWRDMLQPSIAHCEGVLRVEMQRELCFAMARSRSQVMSMRLALVAGHGSQCGGNWARREGRAALCKSRGNLSRGPQNFFIFCLVLRSEEVLVADRKRWWFSDRKRLLLLLVVRSEEITVVLRSEVDSKASQSGPSEREAENASRPPLPCAAPRRTALAGSHHSPWWGSETSRRRGEKVG